jgi:hypothetical protein
VYSVYTVQSLGYKTTKFSEVKLSHLTPNSAATKNDDFGIALRKIRCAFGVNMSTPESPYYIALNRFSTLTPRGLDKI